ncbi:flavodoxin [Virgibacillus byunsanensis]|uniref:Flavodoxin n=1 Tax=Virgibacillus byunsanensis TaxID=570945 RepID=A0ABW3LR07_9BACI
MSKILMLYASTTGNTELMAEAMVDYLEQEQHEVVTKTFDFDPIDVEELLEYDGILVGTYSWDDGAIPYEVEDFYDEVEDVTITGKPIGVFGSADSFYDTYGGAIDLMGKRLEELGAKVIPTRLKVDLEPDAKDVVQCQAFAAMLTKMIDE